MTAAAAQPLEQALAAITAAPGSASALTLYALVCTLEQPRSGCLFRLDKLVDLEPVHRSIAYGLMETLATGGVATSEWRQLRAQIEAVVRG
ncbi:hypothetical protein [Marichromatium gracile]|uniref:Uncharacterized protein n=1 Tax=Marichromatium gracile TaxID=1048 RepID=A0ABR5VFF1_MARGR|nr:hypothetical protein [Marichromatium gracile]KXX64455.1 hypothetical protein AY586_02460 [Marichromatium gracile]